MVKKEKVTVKEMLRILFRNDQLMVVTIALLLHTIALELFIALAINFFYFEFGYGGEQLTIFTVVFGIGTFTALGVLPMWINVFNRMKIIIYKFQVKRELINDFIKIMETLTVESLKEEGCMSYEMCQSEKGQNFTLLERWSSQEAIEAHKKSGHYVQLIPTLKTLLEESCAEVLQVI